MKFLNLLFLFLIALINPAEVVYGIKAEKPSSQDTISYVSPFHDDNERCFKCHGQSWYEFTNESDGRTIKATMCPERVTDRKEFYNANHKSFGCTDCHSSDYVTWPHDGALRMEQQYNCLDCHGGDEMYSRFSFEEIDTDYQKSVHFKLAESGFTCWKCHDPHSYKLSIRDAENIKDAVLYDNHICLNCHSDYNQFKLLSDRAEMNVIDKHDWLPNQQSHFRSVRCIECHTAINDSLLVSHFIVPKEQAVKDCNDCHSKNSILMASLYKFKSREQRKDGFLNGIIMNESYVIGANRNKYLNLLSLVLFGVVFLVIGTHVIFRLRR